MNYQTYEFYAARAAEAATEAEAATLDNVRDRALRSQATWLTLAAQAKAVMQRRVRLESEKAAERDAAVQAGILPA